MKRDMDLVRRLLLLIEEKDNGSGNPIELEGLIGIKEGHFGQDPRVAGHLETTNEAGLIDALVSAEMGGGLEVHPRRLTWEGHDFLDTIRDEGVWSSTKEAVGKAGGTAALETWKATAREVTGQLIGAAIRGMAG